MSYDYNKVTILGRCNGNAVFSQKEEKTPYIRFEVITKETKSPKEDGKEEKIMSTHHKMIAFGQKANVLNDYIQDGAMLLIEGRLQYERGREDSSKEFNEIIVSDFFFIHACQNDVNKIGLCGHLGDDPTIRYNAEGIAYAHLSLCTNYGQRHDWHKIVLSYEQADFAKECFCKGDKIYVEGKISRRSWVDKNSQTKLYRTEIIDVSMSQLVSHKRNSVRSPAIGKTKALDFDKAIHV